MKVKIDRSKIRAYLYRHVQAFKASIHQLGLSFSSTIMTFVVVGIALALPMGLYVLLKNVQVVVTGLHATTQMTLYLDKRVKKGQADDLLRVLKNDINIIHTQYISPEEGLKTFQGQFGNVVNKLGTNPLPGAVIVQPGHRIRTMTQANELLGRLKKLPSVTDAQLDMDWLQRLNGIIALGQRLIHVLMLFFAFAVLLVVGNTIRLMTQNYHDEIMVIKLLGGENNFIRRPFLYSGVIYGLMGGITAWLLVNGIVRCLQRPLEHLMNLYHSSFTLSGLSFQSTLCLLIGGTLLGYLGSWLAVGQHIKAIEPE